jgi:hypothetical protein
VKRNFTVSLPGELIREAKIVAAQRGTSVNAMIQQSLEKAVRSDDDYTAALGRVLETTRRGLYDLGTKRMKRHELYDR